MLGHGSPLQRGKGGQGAGTGRGDGREHNLRLHMGWFCQTPALQTMDPCLTDGVYPMLQVTLNGSPVLPAVVGLILAEFAIEWLAPHTLAAMIKYFFESS